jgi:DNA-binding NarL/FixJ family response regulator
MVELLGAYSKNRLPCQLAGLVEGGTQIERQAAPSVANTPPKQVHRRLRSEERSRLIERYRSGAQAAELATEFGIHPDTVRAIVTEAGVRRWLKRLTSADLVEARRLLAEGASMRAVGRRLGVSPETVKRQLRLSEGGGSCGSDAPEGP